MCELFGVSARNKTEVNGLLKEFFSHSEKHPNGWGMAVFYENAVSLEKEPVKASQSAYLKERLRHRLEVRTMIAHIRFATVGNMEYTNCHPFVKRDDSGRSWTLAHNGTIFDYPALSPYLYEQEGNTDSERILCFFVDKINEALHEAGRALTKEERFGLIDGLVCDLAGKNKLNFLLYDGELLYAHTNYANSLYVCRNREALFFATVPLTKASWSLHPFNRLCAYEEGRRVFTGTDHGKEYVDNEKDMKFIFTDYAGL